MAQPYKILFVLLLTNLMVLSASPQTLMTREERLHRLKLQRLQQNLCQHYITLLEQGLEGKTIPPQYMTIFQEILAILKEIAITVEKITRNKPDDPLRDAIPRLKKILIRSEKIKSDQQHFVLGDFIFITPHCQPIDSIDEQPPVIDEPWKKTDAYRGPETSPYEVPTQVLVDDEENLYVLDRSLKRIFKFDSKGNYIPCHFDEMTLEEQWTPTSMAVSCDRNRTLWVYESWQGEKNISPPSSGRIRIYTMDGIPTIGWNKGKELTACERMSFPLKGLIALDIENNLIIVDQESGVMTKCDSNGNFLNQWGERKEDKILKVVINSKKLVTDPQGLMVDMFGLIYVSDAAGHGIQRYYPDGEWISGWSYVRGKDLYFFDSPHGLAVDEKFYVYVSDTKNHRIKKYTSGGERLLWYLGKNNAQKGMNYGEFNNPTSVAVNSDGTIIYVADTGNKRVQKFLIQK